GQSVRDAHSVLHQVTACLDETSQRPHVLTLALEGCKPLWMTEKEVESQRCVRRVVFRAARNERATVLGEHRRVDGEDDEEVVLEESRDDGTFRELDAHGDGTATEPLAQTTCPRIDYSWAVLEHGGLECGCTGDVKADIVFPICPVDSNEGGEVRRFLLHGNLLDLGSGRDMQRRAQRMQYGEPVKAAFPEDSFRAKAHPRVRSRVSDRPSDRRCRFVARGCMSRFSLPAVRANFKKPNGQPIKALQQATATPSARTRSCRDAAGSRPSLNASIVCRD